MAGLAAFGLTPQQALAVRQMRFWLGLGASAGDPLIEFGMRGAAEHGYDVLFNNFSNEGDTKFTAAYGANDLPDMFETDYPYMGGFLDIGALDPMDDMLAAVNYPLDKVLPHILDRCRWDGKLYAVPHGWNSWVLFYNLDHLDAAGLPTDREPENLEEFVEWAKMTTLRNSTGDIIQSGFMCPRSGLLPNNIWGALLYQYGGSVVSDDGTGTNFNNEAGRKAAEFVLNCLYEWEITDPNITQRYDYWLQGLGTTFYSGTWVVGSSLQQNLNFHADVMPILGDKRAVMYEYSGLVLPYGRPDDVQEAVGNIYKYIVERAGEFAVASSQIPVTMEGLQFPGYLSSPHKRHFQGSEDNGEYAFWDVSHPKGTEFSVYGGASSAVTRTLDKVWDKSVTMDEGLAELDEHLSGILAKQPA
jgi:ABC-type glycerol-3-phosphate transport system substrate-binding protein